MDSKQLIKVLSDRIAETSNIDKELFAKMGVKRGLRNEDHSGVLAGLTRVGDVVGYERQQDGTLKPIPGKLFYRGIDVEALVQERELLLDRGQRSVGVAFASVENLVID